jgi:hypothetical protein
MTINDGNSGARNTAWRQQDLAALRDRVRSAAQFPGVEAEEVHGHVGFAVQGRRFAWLLVDHHGDGRLALVLKAPAGDQEALVGSGRGYFLLPRKQRLDRNRPRPQRPTRLGRDPRSHRAGLAHDRDEDGDRPVGQDSQAPVTGPVADP